MSRYYKQMARHQEAERQAQREFYDRYLLGKFKNEKENEGKMRKWYEGKVVEVLIENVHVSRSSNNCLVRHSDGKECVVHSIKLDDYCEDAFKIGDKVRAVGGLSSNNALVTGFEPNRNLVVVDFEGEINRPRRRYAYLPSEIEKCAEEFTFVRANKYKVNGTEVTAHQHPTLITCVVLYQDNGNIFRQAVLKRITMDDLRNVHHIRSIERL